MNFPFDSFDQNNDDNNDDFDLNHDVPTTTNISNPQSIYNPHGIDSNSSSVNQPNTTTTSNSQRPLNIPSMNANVASKEAKPSREELESNEDDYVNVYVRNESGQDARFKLKKTARLAKLMKVYHVRQGFPLNTFRFIFDGDVIHPDDTPQKLGMQDKDLIEVMFEQEGGYL
eukprot:TRINITY_DN2277_c0_g1_i1.p2 TRINITY_DN2277_c0_g1~~TRINITY_DN2277_c0_g1_i1.p2  ORF type:complete len:172 (-),score=58.76 TRINITY_DN2277_c0_g1_i1:72-587(-)